MAMAKNLVDHDVWGISKHEFSSSSSSLLWTASLAFVYFVFGVNEHAPWIMALLSAIGLLILVYRLLRSLNVPGMLNFILLLCLTLLFPVVPLIRTGMEHILHGLLAILFAWLAAKILQDENDQNGKGHWFTRDEQKLLAVTPILATIRYEGLFEIAVVIILFALKKRYILGVAVGLASAIPLLVYGLISIQHDNYLIPNSLLLKSNLPDFSSLASILQSLGLHGFTTIMNHSHLTYLFLLVMILFLFGYYNNSKTLWDRTSLFLLIFILTFLLHMQYAKIGWFFRYEAYLVGWGIFAAGLSLYLNFPRLIGSDKNLTISSYALLAGLLLAVSSYTLIERGVKSLVKTVPATTNIYEQQYQMGRFIREYYSGEAVMVNDVGAVSFLADFQCFDKVGVANIRVMNAVKSNDFTPESLKQMCLEAGVKIAIVYRRNLWLSPGIPKGWRCIGKWTIRNNVVCSSKTVDFFAVDRNEEGRLRDNFSDFTKSLPASVMVKEYRRSETKL